MVLSSKDYWHRRAEVTLILGEKTALQYEKGLKRAYEETIRSIRKEIQAFYQKHSDETGVTLASARRRLKPDELKDFNATAKIYLDEIERLGDKAFTQEYRDYLKKLSGRAHISQMEEFITNIRHNIETLATGYNTGLGDTMKKAYEDGYYRTLFDAQKQAGIGVSFTAPGDKQLQAAIHEKWLGANYSSRIWTDKKKLVDGIEQMISQEFVRGRGPAVLAQQFADRLNVSFSNAQRLIRTEINYISNKGSIQAYKDTGIVERYRYLATLDSRTSEMCRELDGKIFEIKEAKAGINLPPLHPYCRSTTVPHFEDDEIGSLISDRIARDADGEGKSIRLGENLSFFDWVDKYGSESFKARVTKHKSYYADTNMASTIIESLVAEELMKEFDPMAYRPLTQDEIIEVMKAYYGGGLELDRYDMPQAYRDYVATGNSFRMNELMYRGTYQEIKDGLRSPSEYEKRLVNSIDLLKGYISEAPRLPKDTQLVRFVDAQAVEGLMSQIDSISPGRFMRQLDYVRVDGNSQNKADIIAEFNSTLAGVQFEAQSFISTSYNIKQNVFTRREYILEIYADKGTNALMTYNHEESEVVLNTGTRFEFLELGFKVDHMQNDKVVIKLRAFDAEK